MFSIVLASAFLAQYVTDLQPMKPVPVAPAYNPAVSYPYTAIQVYQVYPAYTYPVYQAYTPIYTLPVYQTYTAYPVYPYPGWTLNAIIR